MEGKVLDGKALAKKMEVDLSERVQKFREKNNDRPPILATILVQFRRCAVE